MSLNKKAQFTSAEFTITHCRCSEEKAEQVIADISNTDVSVSMRHHKPGEKVIMTCVFNKPIDATVLRKIAHAHIALDADYVTTSKVHRNESKHNHSLAG